MSKAFTMKDAADVFGNPEFAGITVPVFAGYEENPYLARPLPNFVFRSDFLRVFIYAIRRMVKRSAGMPRRGMYLGGPAGSGKTTALEQGMQRIGLPIASVTVGASFEVADTISSMEVVGGDTVAMDGIIALAAKGGFPVLINEISKTTDGKLSLLYDLIDRGQAVTEKGERIEAARNFTIWATDNTLGFGDFKGENPDANILAQPLRERFLMVDYGYPTQDEEMTIVSAALKQDFPKLDPEILTRAVTFGRSLRSSAIPGGFSTRRLIDFVDAVYEWIAIRMEMGSNAINPLRNAYQTLVRDAIEAKHHKEAADELFRTNADPDWVAP
jgi:MoxR-like ATPase